MGRRSRGRQASSGKRSPAAPERRLAPRAVAADVARALRWNLRVQLGLGAAILCALIALALSTCADLHLETYDAAATATITDVEQIGRKYTEYRVQYRFVDAAGIARSGIAYASKALQAGETREVEYQRAAPVTSRLRGMRTRRYGPGSVLLFATLALGGVAFALYQLRRGQRELRLLRFGLPATGALVGLQIDEPDQKAARKRLSFAYEVGGQRFVAETATYGGLAKLDSDGEPLLYDPDAPSRAVAFAYLPGSPRLTARDELATFPIQTGYLLILPVAFAVLLVVAAFAALAL